MASIVEKVYALLGDAWSTVRGVAIGYVNGDGVWSPISASSPMPVTANGPDYETVAASQSAQVLGATGAAGDPLSHLLIIPATLNPGAVSITDGGGSAITVFTGGTASISTLHPFVVQISAKSVSGAWKVTTGANVSVIAFGDFT